MPTEVRASFPTYWNTFGNGPRNALLIHCSLAHSGAWGGLVRELTDTLTMTAFDVPGHGRSGAWDEACGEIQGLTTNVAASFLEGPTDIIGHSFGGTVALRLAIEHPELVRSLTLIEPVFFAVAAHDDPKLGRQLEETQKGFSDAWEAGDREAAAREFVGVWGDGRAWETISAEQRTQMVEGIHMVPAANDAIYHDTPGILASGAIQKISAPTTLIEGSESPHFIAAINRGLKTRIPNCERSIIRGAGHMVPITHPKKVAAEILKLLARS